MEQLPVDCINCILALTSPKDVCRLAGVSSALRSAADSDLLWKTFLPADHREIIAQSSSSSLSSFLNSLPEKALYFHLSDHPLLVGTGNSSFSIEKESGRKCYMIGAKDLDIIITMRMPYSMTWERIPQSRFFQVAVVTSALPPRLISTRIHAKKLTPKTYYAAYFVFKFWIKHYIPIFYPILSLTYCEGFEVKEQKTVRKWELDLFVARPDGWMEIEIGQIFIKGDNGSILFSIGDFKGGLIIEGIEIRPISKNKGKRN